MDYAQAKKWVQNQSKKVAGKWWVEANKNNFANFYLYFKPGAVTVAESLPGEDWQLANPKRLTGTKEQVYQFCYDTLFKCPCLPE